MERNSLQFWTWENYWENHTVLELDTETYLKSNPLGFLHLGFKSQPPPSVEVQCSGEPQNLGRGPLQVACHTCFRSLQQVWSSAVFSRICLPRTLGASLEFNACMFSKWLLAIVCDSHTSFLTELSETDGEIFSVSSLITYKLIHVSRTLLVSWWPVHAASIIEQLEWWYWITHRGSGLKKTNKQKQNLAIVK